MKFGSSIVTHSSLAVLGATLFAFPALAVAPYSPPASVQAQKLVEMQLIKSDLKTITRPIQDASACGINGSATIVDVQVPLAQKITAVDGSISLKKDFVTVKSYVVSTGYGAKIVDAEICISK